MLIILFSKQRKSFHLSFNAKKEGFFVIKEVLFVRVSEINSRARISFSDRKQTESKERKKKTFFTHPCSSFSLSPLRLLMSFFSFFFKQCNATEDAVCFRAQKRRKRENRKWKKSFFFLAFLRFLRQTRDWRELSTVSERGLFLSPTSYSYSNLVSPVSYVGKGRAIGRRESSLQLESSICDKISYS